MARIMIADDAEFMRLVLKKMMEKGGHEVIGEADNGRDAVYLYTMLHPDLITLDITMPFMSGLDAAEKIKEDHPDARILMVSAMGTKDSRERAQSIGVKGFIIKPFQEEQVLNAIEKALEE